MIGIKRKKIKKYTLILENLEMYKDINKKIKITPNSRDLFSQSFFLTACGHTEFTQR